MIRRPAVAPLLGSALLLLPGAAGAASASADIELVHPSASPGSLPGVEGAWVDAAGSVRVSTLTQLEVDPLVVYQDGRYAGEAVARRLAADLALQVAATDRLALSLTVPAAWQWGATAQQAAAPTGPALGDLRLRARGALLREGAWSTAAWAGAWVPTGTEEAWMGEATARGEVGLVAGWTRAAAALGGELSLVGRSPVDTGADWAPGPEVAAALHGRWFALPARLTLGGALLARADVLGAFAGGPNLRAEAIVGLQRWVGATWLLDLGFGRGIGEGPGSSSFRLLAGFTWKRSRPAPPAHPAARVELTTDLPEAEPPAPTPPPVLPPGPAAAASPAVPEPLARLEGERIALARPIRFAFGTDRILAESLPILEEVAAILASEPGIGHLLIEGHASEEGSYEANFALSTARARAVFVALVRAGAHPERMSWRGMGEVEPLPGARDLAANRRVEFHVLCTTPPGWTIPPERERVRLPWSGEEAEVAPLPAASAGGPDEEPSEVEAPR